jgi:predicted DNA-binding transcriptional regulator AlpA
MDKSPTPCATAKPLHFPGERWPRGLRRPDAAAYIGVSPSKFDDWVSDGVLPKPYRRGGIVLWDRVGLDAALDAFFNAEPDPFDDVSV